MKAKGVGEKEKRFLACMAAAAAAVAAASSPSLFSSPLGMAGMVSSPGHHHRSILHLLSLFILIHSNFGSGVCVVVVVVIGMMIIL